MYYYSLKVKHSTEMSKNHIGNFHQENGYLYFFNSDSDLLLVTTEATNRIKVYDKVSHLFQSNIRLEDYSSIEVSDFIDKIDKDKLGAFGLFALQHEQQSVVNSLDVNQAVLAELDSLIALSNFKKTISHLVNYVTHVSANQIHINQEKIVLIFNGQKGTGRKFAIHFMERLFNMNSVSYNCKYQVLPKIDNAQFLVVYDYFDAFKSRKIDLLKDMNDKTGMMFSIFIADSTDEANNIKEELLDYSYNVEIVDFLKYSITELQEIALQMLNQRGVKIDKKILENKLVTSHYFKDAKTVRYLINQLYHYAVKSHYLFEKSDYLDLSQFSLLKNGMAIKVSRSQNKLDNMVGLKSVKTLLKEQIAYSKLSKVRKECGFQVNNIDSHLIFSGSPGTGKTEVARLYTEILYESQIIKENKLVEVGRADLVGEYIGHTAPKIKRVFQQASGGVLFIDEAYSLIPQSERDFANEAIPAILQEMENRRDEVIVIFAGYKNLMADFIKVNPGLQSRISKIIHFDDYTSNELYEIFQYMLKNRDYHCSVEGENVLLNHFEKIGKSRNFGNARYVRKLINAILYQQAIRVMDSDDLNKLEENVLNSIVKDDIEGGLAQLSDEVKPVRVIGFGVR